MMVMMMMVKMLMVVERLDRLCTLAAQWPARMAMQMCEMVTHV